MSGCVKFTLIVGSIFGRYPVLKQRSFKSEQKADFTK